MSPVGVRAGYVKFYESTTPAYTLDRQTITRNHPTNTYTQTVT